MPKGHSIYRSIINAFHRSLFSVRFVVVTQLLATRPCKGYAQLPDKNNGERDPLVMAPSPNPAPVIKVVHVHSIANSIAELALLVRAHFALRRSGQALPIPKAER